MPLLRAISTGLCAAAVLALALSAARADDPFYKGKRLTLLINFAAGGPSDIEGRLLVKHIGKHLDGAPSIIVQSGPARMRVRSSTRSPWSAPPFASDMRSYLRDVAGRCSGSEYRQD